MRSSLAYVVMLRSGSGAVHPTFGSHRVVNLSEVTEHNRDRDRFPGERNCRQTGANRAVPGWPDKLKPDESRGRDSVGPVAGEHAGDGLQQDLPIQRQRPVVDVLHVQLHPTIEIDVVPARNGP